MDFSNGIVTDQNGYFHHPDGLPLVVIFDSKHGEKKAPSEISWQEPVVGLQTHRPENDTVHIPLRKFKEGTKPKLKPIKFVNTSRPGHHDSRKKKPTRLHVINGRQKQKQKNSRSGAPVDKGLKMEAFAADEPALSKESFQACSKEKFSHDLSISPKLFATLDPFNNYPVKLEPYMYPLLQTYVSLISEVARSSGQLGLPGLGHREPDLPIQGWLPLAMTDPALFHGILCGSALYFHRATGQKTSIMFKHMKESVHIVSTRLQNPDFELSDSTIITVAHMADFECILGNYANWRLHMDGLYKMVQIRGGISLLDSKLKSKIWRADLIGCLCTLSKPRFKVIDILGLAPAISPETAASTLCEGFKAIAELLPFDDDFLSVLGDLQCMTSVLNISTIDLPTIDRTIVPIQYQLLFHQSTGTKHSTIVDPRRLCAIGALVYLQNVHSFHLRLHLGGTSRVLMDGALIDVVKNDLNSFDTNAAQTKELFLWVLFLCGVAVVGTKQRIWFVATLAKIIVELHICSWDEVKMTLMKFLWVDRIHEDPCREIWEEVQTTLKGFLPKVDSVRLSGSMVGEN